MVIKPFTVSMSPLTYCVNVVNCIAILVIYHPCFFISSAWIKGGPSWITLKSGISRNHFLSTVRSISSWRQDIVDLSFFAPCSYGLVIDGYPRLVLLDVLLSLPVALIVSIVAFIWVFRRFQHRFVLSLIGLGDSVSFIPRTDWKWALSGGLFGIPSFCLVGFLGALSLSANYTTSKL